MSTPSARGKQEPVPLTPLTQAEPCAPDLPLPLTSLVGREREVAAVRDRLAHRDVRLVTLTGPGGVGKTRLALRVAEEEVYDPSPGTELAFPDGVWFVPLAPVRDPVLVISAVAQALGMREGGGRPLVEGLKALLRDRASLLVIDNFEHVLDAAPLVTDLLGACPRLAFLVTSRERLRVSGEQEFPVPPLALPDPAAVPPVEDLIGCAAIQLFVDRASATQPGFLLNSANAHAVARICHRLDGLPLAIELVAARISHLSTSEILVRLEQGLPLLTGGPQDQPARLRTMRAAIAWSYDLLADNEQALFRRLSVFAGGFTLDGAQAVAGLDVLDSVFDLLSSLFDKSLLNREEGVDGRSRFAMLETLREFALEQLAASGEEAAIRDVHAAHVLALVERAEPHLFGPDQAIWLDRLEAELPNIRAACGWLHASGRAAAGLRLAAAPGRFWWRRGYLGEGRSWLARFLSLPVAEPATSTRVKALLVAGSLAAWQKDSEQSLAWHTEALDLARQLGDAWGLAMALLGLGSDALNQGDLARAESLLAQSAARFQDLGDAAGIAKAKERLGTAAFAQGDYARAAACLAEALAVSRQQQDWRFAAAALDGLAQVALGRGDSEGARGLAAESLALSARLGDKSGIAWCLMDLAGVAAGSGQPEAAARLLGASAALRGAIGAGFGPHEQRLHDRIGASAKAQLEDATFAAAWARGAALPLAEAIVEATAVAEAGVSRVRPAVIAGLTPRELEVLRLLAEGKSDKEIAAALFVSRRTTAHHVAAIFRKLGVTSRAAAAAFAVRHGLA